VPMGFARGEAARLSVELTKLAVDVASFNNASDTETMAAFQSALVGNHETVRRFGIVITEATLQQELYRMGVKQNAQDVDNATKVQARMNLILAGTTDAQGDAARTADSFANTSKALKAALDELLVNVVTPLLPALTNMARGLANATNSLNEFLVAVGMIDEVGRPQENILRDLTAVEAELTEKTIKLAQARKDLQKATEGLTKDDVMSLLFPMAKGGDATGNAALGGLQRLKNNIVELQTEISVLTTDAQKLNSELADTLDAPTGDSGGGTQTKTKGQIKSENKVTKALNDQRFAVRLLNDEIDGRTSAELRALKVTRDLTSATDDQLNEILRLIREEERLQAQIDATAATKKASAELNALEFNSVASEQAADATMLVADSFAVVTEEIEKFEEANKEAAKATVIVADSFGLITQEIDKFEEEATAATMMVADSFGVITDEIHKFESKAKELDPMTKEMHSSLASMSRGISASFADMVVSGKMNLDSLQNIFSSFAKTMISKAFELAVINRIMNSVFSLSGTSGELQTIPLPKLGASAGGGRVQGPTLVGERGPELFVPSSAGVIRNNHDTKNMLGQSGAVVNQSINIDAGVSQTVRAEIMTMMPVFKQQALEAVVESRRRGGQVASAFGR